MIEELIIKTVIMTILSIVAIIALVSWFDRMMDLKDHVWIEPVIIAVCGLLMYLVVR